MDIESTVKSVVIGFDNLIMMSLQGVAREQYFPCANPDNMDDRIKRGKERAIKLREMRNAFEDLCAGVL